MIMLKTVYATDEDIALRASADFPILCPKDQKIAAGSDGAFRPDAPWTLISASSNFAAQGAAPGQVALLTKPVTSFKPPGEVLVIASASTTGVTLRRKGQGPGIGQPPGPASGLVGVEFAIVTLGPQIESASYEINRIFGIDDLVSGRRSIDLYDPREVQQATILTVLYRQYLDMSREAGDQADTFAAKARFVKAELDDLLARVVVRWGAPNPSMPGGSQPCVPYLNATPATSRFCTRLSR